jgi:hypothetical protein
MGMGNFYNYLPVEKNIYGCELDIKAYKLAKFLYPEANLQCEDIRNYYSEVKFDIVVGNPPYSLTWQVGKDEYLSQLYYCIKAAELLKPAGLMALIMPNSFLADAFSDGGMIKTINSLFNFVCQFDIPADSFKNVGVYNFETKIMFFQKKSEHLQEQEYTTNNNTITGITEQQSTLIYNKYIQPLQEQKDKIKNKIFFENLHNGDSEEAKEFIAVNGFDPIYGARPLKRYIQRNLETKLAREIIAGNIHDHSKVNIIIENGELKIHSMQ